jgi:hypothetical protein
MAIIPKLPIPTAIPTVPEVTLPSMPAVPTVPAMPDVLAPIKSKIDSTLDFTRRAEGEASTSKYIQTKLPNADGIVIPQTVTGLPDQKIIAPNLTKATCETFDMKKASGGLLASLLAALGVPALKKTPVKKEIKEIAPDFAKSEYGFIQVKETKGGHVEIIDNTKGNERTMKLHPSGSYNQILPNGTIQDKITGDKITFIDGEYSIVIGREFIEVVNGNNKIQIKKDNQLNINGNNNINIDKDSNTIIGGNCDVNVKGSSSEKVTKDKTVDVSGKSIHKAKSSVEEITGNKNITTGGSLTIAGGGSMNCMASGNVILSGGSITVLSNGASISIRNGRIDINGPLFVNGFPYGEFTGQGFSPTPDLPIDENSKLF